MNDEEYCGACNGSGEGSADGTTCSSCHGSGVDSSCVGPDEGPEEPDYDDSMYDNNFYDGT